MGVRFYINADQHEMNSGDEPFEFMHFIDCSGTLML